MKKIGIGLLVMIAGTAIWYFGIKEEDYRVSFQVKGTPQSTYDHILKWKSWGNSEKENSTNTFANRFDEIHQKVALQDTTLHLHWKIEKINDSITGVSVSAKAVEYSTAIKLGVLKGDTVFTKSLQQELKRFRTRVNSFTDSYRIVVDGIVDVPSFTYLYVTDTTQRDQKAARMIAANMDVYPIIGEYRVEKDGFPFVKVNTWEIENDSIIFDFGFPIRQQDSLPLNDRIRYGFSKPFKALRATFYGNYSKSDQAWFALLNYAKENDIEVKNEPLEIFYNNPMQGGDDRTWKAEVFIPLIE